MAMVAHQTQNGFWTRQGLVHSLAVLVFCIMSESDLYAEIIGSYSNGATRVFRQNAGMAYQGRVLERTPHRLILAPWYPIRLGIAGMSDLGGLTSVLVTESMIGQHMGIDIAIECKAGRVRPTEEQSAYIAMVRRLGGRAGVARSVEEAGRIIRGEII